MVIWTRHRWHIRYARNIRIHCCEESDVVLLLQSTFGKRTGTRQPSNEFDDALARKKVVAPL